MRNRRILRRRRSISGMIKKFRYQFLLLLVLIIGGVILQSLLNKRNESEKQKQQSALIKTHEETVINIEAGIDVYATVVSSIKAFLQNSEEFPSEQQLQGFLSDLISETNFKDSIVVSWVDTNQVFQYVVTPYEIDPNELKGVQISDLRPDFEVEKLNAQMFQEGISLYDPINLIEGWAAFPFNFSAKNSKGEVLGYIAPVLNVKYLLDFPYKLENERFLYKFTLENNIDLTREVVYDGTTIYNENRDPEYYKNFVDENSHFIYSTVEFYDLKLQIGTAYKELPKTSIEFTLITYLWYTILCMFCFVILIQFLRNNSLNRRMKLAYSQIATKNKQLEENINNIQVLIKEVHHRVKNNMQIITSLMNLQGNQLESNEAKAVLEESKARIQSMALVHQKLYGNNQLTNVNVKEYVEQLISYVESTIESSSDVPIKRVIIPSRFSLNMDTMIPLGLIINELVTNSYKYAFKENGDKWITIEIQNRKSEGIKLVYSDSGPGIPDHINPEESGTLGLELIHILTEQLDGEVFYNNSGSSTFTITFTKADRK